MPAPARRPTSPAHRPKGERASPARYLTHPHAADVDLRGLQASLRREVRGEVLFDAGARGAYATDASNFRQVPLGVVCPADVDDVVAAVAACREHGAPVTHRGGGTSLAGEACNVAVVIDTSRHVDRIAGIDAAGRTARVEPGVVLDSLRAAANPHGLTFGPDPATHNRCTLGGMIGNNSCGAHSMLAGRTSDNVVDLDVLLYDGTRLTVGATAPDELDRIVSAGGRQGQLYGDLRRLAERYGDDVRARFPAIRRRVSGFNLDALLPERGFDLATALVGTEGTCVTVLGATLRLVDWPAHRVVLALGFPDIVAAAADVPTVLEHRPIACEAVGHAIATSAAADPRGRALLPAGSDYLLVEFGGESRAEARAAAERARRALVRAGGPSAALLDEPDQAAAVWGVREVALGTAALLRGTPPAWAGWEDAAVAPDALASYLSGYLDLCGRYGFADAALYGHFGDGCVHTRIPFDFSTPGGVARYRDFLTEAADLVVGHGGSLSGEHGDGQQRGPLLERMYGADLVEAFHAFQAAFDPDDRMNPGKVTDPVRTFDVDENLRVDPESSREVRTRMRLGADGHDLATASLRCVGMGVCRRDGGGTMCPSFMVTRDERHSTRGRARLLFEMAEGEVVTGGWRSPEVAEALDLCLSCKGCKHDCPVGVDMATYKAEFLHHHFRGRLRPRPAYSMGLISYAARLGSAVPRIANAALHSPGVSTALKRVAGVHPDRAAPTFAKPTFRRWFNRRAGGSPGGRRVIVFPDTFTNFFHPQVGRAVVAVLEAAGLAPVLPDGAVCCGRPCFDYGMLDVAAHLYRRLLRTLAADIAAGTPVVVPEPSCAASLRDELVAVLPDNPAARKLSGLTMTLAECLQRYAPTWAPRVEVDALVQAHCHQRAVLGMEADQEVLSRAGARWAMPADFGCCGLAGAWGFEADHHELSLACGERALFPAVRSASAGTVLLADGFSCRTQIAQGTGRHAIHLSELLASAL